MLWPKKKTHLNPVFKSRNKKKKKISNQKKPLDVNPQHHTRTLPGWRTASPVAARTQPQHPRMIADLTPHIALPGQSSTERLSPAWCNYTTPESGGAGADTGLEAALCIYSKIFVPSFTPVFQWSGRKIFPP